MERSNKILYPSKSPIRSVFDKNIEIVIFMKTWLWIFMVIFKNDFRHKIWLCCDSKLPHFDKKWPIFDINLIEKLPPFTCYSHFRPKIVPFSLTLLYYLSWFNGNLDPIFRLIINLASRPYLSLMPKPNPIPNICPVPDHFDTWHILMNHVTYPLLSQYLVYHIEPTFWIEKDMTFLCLCHFWKLTVVFWSSADIV